MKVSFISIDDEKNKINFTSDVLYIDNIYRFNDGSTQNTTIELEIIGECVRLTRTGDINMYMLFDNKLGNIQLPYNWERLFYCNFQHSFRIGWKF